jgi:hypothetical protein
MELRNSATRIYLSGPMTGLPDYNYPAFNAEAARLRALGYTVENPAENPLPADAPWHMCMRDAIRQMLTCDTVAFLPGWQVSRGANVEIELAGHLRMAVIESGGIVSPQEEVMSNQANRLSDCPAERLALCRGDVATRADEVDFGIDGRSVRVSQEAYSIFLAREQMGKHRVAALQQRLNIADQRIDDLQMEIAKLRRGPCELIYGDELPSQGIPGTTFQRLNALANEGE